jgi:hypothetical protein
VPAWPPRADGGVPGRLVVFGPLPQDEVPDVLLGVLVGVHPGAGLHAADVDARELPVLGKRIDLEIDRPVSPVGVSPLFELRTNMASVYGQWRGVVLPLLNSGWRNPQKYQMNF